MQTLLVSSCIFSQYFGRNHEALHSTSFYPAATLLVDGEFSASAYVETPFKLGIDANGYFRTPFFLDLTNPTPQEPDIVLEMDFPTLPTGCLNDLSFEDIVGVLDLLLEFLVGDEEGDTVESCSGGLLGKEVLGTNVFVKKLPVVGVSACDSAGYLKVLVDAIDELVNECSSDSNDGADAEECDGTFQSLEKKLEVLLEG